MNIEELRKILVECAGEGDLMELSGDIGNVEFEHLGYDSLAVIETASRIQREFGIVIAEEYLLDVRTPQELIDIVNSQLG
ncbi:acyl carrier protein [Nocardia sp. NPDC058114]|uniref:acyl carrier protein n=1 Tax=Nocardia sp. NPDC058114 TaxID=3346346 RepID=UPI0036D78BEC